MSLAAGGLGWLLVACSVDDALLGSVHGDGVSGGGATREAVGGSSGTGDAAAGDAAAGDATAGDGSSGGVSGGSDAGGAPSTCSLTSPTVIFEGTDDAEYATCTGRIASTLFLNALCTCADTELGEYLMTRGFDSSEGAFDSARTDDSGAAVGINGNYVAEAGQTDVGGSFSVAGSQELVFVGSLDVRGDFRAAGDITTAGSATIARDAWLGGSYLGMGPLTVGGELHHAGAVVGIPLLAATDSEEDVTVPAPCPCGGANTLDVGALVDQAQHDSDDARFGVAPDALEAISDTTVVQVRCGRFFFSRVSGRGDVEFRVMGASALFIDGSIELDGSLTVRLEPGAELDVFVRDGVDVSGAISLAEQDRPAAGRLYVGGDENVALGSPFVGNLYAPRARVVASGVLEVWGSIFAREFSTVDSASFIFDRAIYEASRTCGEAQPPPGSCSTCGSCAGGLACVDGACGPCRTDDDCCSQTVCANGSCAPLIEVR